MFSGFTGVGGEFWTHICRSEGTAVSQTGSQSRSIGGGQVQDHSGRSVLDQTLHCGPAQTRRAACNQADHSLRNTQTHTRTGTDQRAGQELRNAGKC